MKPVYTLIFSCLLFRSVSFAQEMTKQETGYFNITEIGFFAGLSASYPDHPEYRAPNGGRVRTINGVFLSPEWSLGLGIGTDWYNRAHDDGLFSQYNHTLPVFLDARYYIHQSRNTPFIYSDIGYSLNLFDSFDKGLMLGLGGGYKFFPGARTALVASVGYIFQQISEAGAAGSGNLDLHSTSLQLGLLF